MLNNLMSAVPQVLNLIGQGKSQQELAQYAANLCKSQNIPLEQVLAQVNGLVRLAGGEQNVKKVLNSYGFKL